MVDVSSRAISLETTKAAPEGAGNLLRFAFIATMVVILAFAALEALIVLPPALTGPHRSGAGR